MMKSFKLLASIAAISAVFGCASTAPSMTDGTYTGVGQGRNGELTVEVKVDAGKLSAVRVVKHVETVGISDAAVKQMPARIVDAQSLKVDAVSGATLTSEGIRTAVADAIRKAGGDPDAFATAVVTKKAAARLIKEKADVVVVGAGGAGTGAISHRLFPLRFTLYPAFSQLCLRKSAVSPSSLLKEGREIIPFNRSIAS